MGTESSPSAPPVTSDKPTSGAGNQQNRGRGFRKPGNPSNFGSGPKEVKFEGRVEALNGHIYDCSYKQADHYTKTTREIAEYIGRTYKYGNDTKLAIESLKTVEFELPNDPVLGATRTEIRVWEKKVDEVVKRETMYEENIKAAYSLVWGQCTDAFRAKLEAHDNHEAVSKAANVLGLLRNIKDAAFNFQSQKYKTQALHEAKRRFYTMYQEKSLSCQAYLEKFRNQVEVIEHCGGTVVDYSMILDALEEAGIAKETATEKQVADATAKAREQYLACAFILGSDRGRYGKMIEDLENMYIQNDNRFPVTLVAAYSLLEYWKQNPRNLMRVLGSTNDGVAFGQTNSEGKKDLSHVKCYNCKETGHYSNKCPNKPVSDANSHLQDAESVEETGNVHVQHGHIVSDDFEDLHSNVTTSFQFCIQGEEPDEITGICQVQAQKLPDTWILLDNGSTIDVFTNPKLLKNIKKTSTTMKIRCNAGVSSTNMQGELEGYGPVWYNPHGIANILSLSKVQEKHRVTYDSTAEGKFIIHKNDGTKRTFSRSESGLFYIDARDATSGDVMLNVHQQKSTTVGQHVMINTVDENRKGFSSREYNSAQLARKTQNMIGRPSTKTYIEIIRQNLLKNCPVTEDDIRNAEVIFGPNLGSLKGKTVRTSSTPVRDAFASLPRSIMEQHRDIVLCADIMFVNQMIFLITLSRGIKFGTVETLPNRKKFSIIKGLKSVQALYTRRGFRVRVGLMDIEFAPLRADLMDLGIELNTTSNDEHVPEIERFIRTVKERTRCTYNTLPYKQIPARMLVEMVHGSVFWLNNFPPAGGISDTISPRCLIVGFHIDFHKHCQLEFGAYAQVHEEHDSTMATRTTGAIALRPTGNVQGGYYFMSLETGRRLNRNHWTELPMPKDVIDRVHVLARRSRANKNLIFADRNGNINPDGGFHPDGADEDDADVSLPPDLDDYIDGDDDDEDYLPPVDIADEDDDVDDANRDGDRDDDPPQALRDNPVDLMDLDIDNLLAEDDPPDDDPADLADDMDLPHGISADDDDEDDSVAADVAQDATGDADAFLPAEELNDIIDDVDAAVHAPIVVDHPPPNLDDLMDAQYGARSDTYNLRARKPRDYGHLHTTLEHTCMTQYSVKKGLKEFGQAGADAVLSELRQLDERSVISPRLANMLTSQEKHRALQYLMFLKKKRCGRIKGRGCADGRKQRMYKSKEETSAPTVSIESLMLSCAIDARESRHIITADIPGAFMQADMDEVLHMKIEGPLATLLMEVNPEKYTPFLYIDAHNRPSIYVLLEKALYGTLQAALLFWRNLSGKLIDWGFTLNPYDTCVANKMYNGSQCTVLWHVDDIKISHRDESVVESVLDLLNVQYGVEAPLVVTRGKLNEYLGMTLNFEAPGTCKVQMKDYIDEMLDEAPSDMDGEAATPAANHLFTVDPAGVLLEPTQAQLFHHFTAKLLFLSKRARPDIQTAVAYLTTRVKNPDQDDYKKLCRVIKYLRGSLDLCVTLEAADINVIKWWVYGSYAIHPDMRSHTGGTMSLGRGSVYSTSIRQKLNTKSSTEAELVAVADVMPQILWTRYFLAAQGYDVEISTIYQDNQSAMLLENNGRASSGRRTRHLNIRYFFVTDRIRSKEVKVEYCPTGIMRGDFFTKPLQGSLFRKFRAEILNL